MSANVLTWKHFGFITTFLHDPFYTRPFARSRRQGWDGPSTWILTFPRTVPAVEWRGQGGQRWVCSGRPRTQSWGFISLLLARSTATELSGTPPPPPRDQRLGEFK